MQDVSRILLLLRIIVFFNFSATTTAPLPCLFYWICFREKNKENSQRSFVMRNAFTMIELIFIIVIIGILAAVAIPKMAATRNDAKIVSLANNIANAANEIAAYSVSKGRTDSNLSKMSNAVQSMLRRGIAVQTGNTLDVKINTVNDCVKMQVVSGVNDTNLTLRGGSAGGDAICRKLQEAIPPSLHIIPLKGSLVRM